MTDDELQVLEQQLSALHQQRDEALRQAYDRSLPFADGMFDRWERARRLGFGDEASIYNSALVFGTVRVGAHTWIGPYTLLDGSGDELQIGAHCSISAGVHIYTHDTVRRALSMGALPRDIGSVSIGDGCHVGAQTVVAAGSSIGDQCVIGANSFVKGALPGRSIAVGSPAVVVGVVRGDGNDITLDYDPEAVRSRRSRGLPGGGR